MGKAERIKRKKRKRLIKRIVGITVCLLLVGVFAYFAYMVLDVNKDTHGDRGFGSEEVSFSVQSGDTASVIAARLKEQGIIKYDWWFEIRAKLDGVATRLQIGEYTFRKDASYNQIFTALQESRARESVRITFSEGVEVAKIIDILVAKGVGSAERYRMIIDSWDFGYDWLPAAGSENRLEGYMFPDTYDFYLDETEESVIKRFLDNFNSKIIKNGVADKAEALGMTLHEAVTLGSIIQMEGNSRTEFEQISSVFHNRLDIDMKLQSCATVNYILPVEQRKPAVSYEDMQIDSPYNTYMYAGLTPTPIANGGYYAILAAVTPADTDYLYFCSDGMGGTVFAKTYAEHQKNVNKYLG